MAAFMRGRAHVPTGGRAPRPGDALVFNSTNERFAVPTTDAERQQVIGVVAYEADRITQVTVSGQDRTFHTQRDDGQPMKIMTCGHMWATAAEALQYGDRLIFNGDYKWAKREDLGDPAGTTADDIKAFVESALAQLHWHAAWCATPSVAADEQFELAFGVSGRVY